AHHTVFGGDVVAGVRVSLQTADRTGQDDRAAATAGQDVRDACLDRLPHTAQVDVDHGGPVRFAGLVQRRAAVADAGVGNGAAQSAQLLGARVHRRFQRVVIADVDLGGVDAAVETLDQISRFGQILRGGRRYQLDCVDLLADVDGDDVGALLRQPHRVRATL